MLPELRNEEIKETRWTHSDVYFAGGPAGQLRQESVQRNQADVATRRDSQCGSAVPVVVFHSAVKAPLRFLLQQPSNGDVKSVFSFLRDFNEN